MGSEVGSEEGTDAEILVTDMDVNVVVTALLEIVVIDGEEREDETESAIVDEKVETVVEERKMEEVDSDCEDNGTDVGPSIDRLLLRTVVLGEAVGLIKATDCETPALPDNIT